MNPGAIYSKSGKGVQEASGKTSLLKRGDRAVLSAIDGRTSLAEVAKKVGKDFDAGFQQLITQLDKDGFVREVTAGAAVSSSSTQPRVATVAAKPAPAAKAAPPPSSASGEDLDFTTIMPAVKNTGAPKAAAPAPKPAVDAAAQQRAREQEAALYKARQEAEARAQAEREKLRQQAEAKARSEAEAKARAEAEAKIKAEAEARAKEAEAKAKEAEARIRAEAEAKAKAAQEAAMKLAAEAKAKAEAEAKAKIEAERRAREEAERKAREEAEQARREAEELRQRLEAERKAREEAERKAREEEEARRRKEDEERQRKIRAEQEAQMRKAREQAGAREKKSQAQTATAFPTLPQLDIPGAEPAEPAAPAGGGLDELMADLDSFSQREEQERQQREAADKQVRAEKERQAREAAERRAREQAAEEERARERAAEEARRREEEEQRRRQEEERRAQEEAERRVREAEELRRREAEEREKNERNEKKAREAAAAAEKPSASKAADADATGSKDARKKEREREREQRQRDKEAKERARAAAERAEAGGSARSRRDAKWGRPAAIMLFMALIIAVGALHIVPLPMEQYEDAASEALGRPVKIGSGKLSLFTGVRLNLENVTIGDSVKIAAVHAYPRIGSLIDERKAFRRIEIQGMTIAQRAIGETLGSKMRGANFDVTRVLVKELKLEGAVPLPTFEADAVLGQDGALRTVTLRGPESLNVKVTPAGAQVEVEATAASFTMPFVPELSLSSFAMKATATRQGMNISSWGGGLYDGALNGTANVRWTNGWQVDGVVTARSINAAVFAPALLSDGKGEGTGRFSMSGTDPAKLYQSARVEGTFVVNKGVLGSFDLARVIRTSGREHNGRTQFTELTGQGSYDRGALALRSLALSAGALGAGASADIAPSGAISGRIIADMKIAGQSQRATVGVAGTVKDPQVRN